MPTAVTFDSPRTTHAFHLRRQSPGVPVTVPLTVTDRCGAWQTVVGGGTGAGF